MDSALQLGKLLQRSGALMNARQPDIVDDMMNTASSVIASLSDSEAGELYAFLSGFFSASAEYAPIRDALHLAAADPAAKRAAIHAAIEAARRIA